MALAKADFFTGAFLTSILKSVDTVPVVCDAKGLTKCLRFSTELGGKFYTYIKYSTRRNDQRDDTVKWYIPFSEKEYVYLSSDFQSGSETKMVVMVCTSENLTNAHICVLNLDEALECLKTTNSNGGRIINVERTGSKHCYSCYGYDGKERATPPFDHLKLFVKKPKRLSILRSLKLK
jgi:hypothetical protein